MKLIYENTDRSLVPAGWYFRCKTHTLSESLALDYFWEIAWVHYLALERNYIELRRRKSSQLIQVAVFKLATLDPIQFVSMGLVLVKSATDFMGSTEQSLDPYVVAGALNELWNRIKLRIEDPFYPLKKSAAL